LPCFEFGKVHSKGLFTVIFYFSHNWMILILY
jgi:hypothetical protein